MNVAIALAPLLATGEAQVPRTILKELLSGERMFAMCSDEVAVQPDLPQGLLELRFAADAQWAQTIVAARRMGDRFETRCFDRTALEARANRADSIDGGTLTTWQIDEPGWEAAPIVASGSAGEAAWRATVDRLRLLDAAYLCGLASGAMAMGIAFLQLRCQFGVPIGSFQALQHRAADLHIQIAATRALVAEAARAFGAPQQSWAAAAAIRRASAVARHVTKENIQFHGAIGFTDEHDAGLYLRRAVVVGARHSSTPLAWQAGRES